jgi:ABC-type dipeptide/oligopeptide/nickel transport system permease subunit
VILAVAAIFWPRVFRVVRNQTVQVREEGYVEAARSQGCGVIRLLSVHVLPNIASALVIQGAFLIGFGIIAEASLSFVGLGVQPPHASWGTLLQEAYPLIYQAPLLIVWPTLAIMLTVWAFASAADGLRDALGRDIGR